MSQGIVAGWFRQKVSKWGSTSEERKDYIKRVGRQGLALEFSSDAEFQQIVCPWIKQIGDIQAKLTLPPMLEGLFDHWFGVPLVGEIDIVIGAIADACGYPALGDQLIKVGEVSLGVAFLLGFFVGLLS